MDWKFECPEGWEVLQAWGEGWAVRQKAGGLRVLIDCEIKADTARPYAAFPSLREAT